MNAKSVFWHVARRGWWNAPALLLLAVMLALAPAAPGQEAGMARPEVRIGVLAFRGEDHARRQWEGLVRWLNRSLPQRRFRLVAVTLDSAGGMLARGDVDFLLTNPGHYVTLAERYPVSVLATLVRITPDGYEVMRFGSVIFTRADAAGIRGLADVKGRRVAAVSDKAFGGFLVGWREFRALGIDLLDDDVEMYFTGFPQDRIVQAVLAGKADVGIVRTGLLESMARERRLDLRKVRILNPVPHPGFPWRTSSRLYPEWPFVARDGVDRILAEQVLSALLALRAGSLRTANGLRLAFTAPLSYREVSALVREFRHARQERETGDTLLVILAMLAVAAAAFAAAWAWRSRQTERTLAAAIPGGLSEEERKRFADLTRRELQVLACLCEGLSSKEIAQRLGIAPKTVEFHRANLLKKTGFSSTTRMVSVAARLGLDTCPGKTRGKTGEAPDGAGAPPAA